MLETFISSASPSLPMMSAIPCLSSLWLSLYFYCQYTTNHAPASPAIMLTTCFLPHFGMFQRKVQLDLKMTRYFFIWFLRLHSTIFHILYFKWVLIVPIYTRSGEVIIVFLKLWWELIVTPPSVLSWNLMVLELHLKWNAIFVVFSLPLWYMIS